MCEWPDASSPDNLCRAYFKIGTLSFSVCVFVSIPVFLQHNICLWTAHREKQRNSI